MSLIMSPSTMAISSTVTSSSKNLPKFKHHLSLRSQPSFSGCTGGSSRRPCSMKLTDDHRKFLTLVSFSGDGTGNGNRSGRSFGGDGSGGDGNEKEALMVLPEGDRSSDSIPEAEMFVGFDAVKRWLLQFGEVKESFLAVVDPIFLEDVVMKVGVRLLTKIATFKAFQGGILDGLMPPTVKRTTIDQFKGSADNTFFAEYRMKCGANTLLSERGRYFDPNPVMFVGLDLLADPLFLAKIVMEFEVGMFTKVVTFKVGGILDVIPMDMGPAIKRMIHFGGSADDNFWNKYRIMKCSSNRLTMI